jgi:hypothetical protein
MNRMAPEEPRPTPKLNAKDLLTRDFAINPTPSKATQIQAQSHQKQEDLIHDLEITEDLDLSDNELQQFSKHATLKLKQFDPILTEEIIDLLFPKGTMRKFQSSWLGKGFNFHIGHTSYGLIQTQGGPCGLIASVQSKIIKHMVYGDSKCMNKGKLQPSTSHQRKALTCAITDILFTIGGTTATLVLSLGTAKQLGVVEGLGYIKFTAKQDLYSAIENRFHEFSHPDENGNGYIQFLLSAILSRGIQNIRSDMDAFNVCLMGQHSYCTQDMVNLLIIGKAISNLYDGDIDIDGTLIKGIKTQSEIGQLSLFEYYNNLKVCLVN